MLERIKSWKESQNELGIIFEYTAPGTSQQNGVVERELWEEQEQQ